MDEDSSSMLSRRYLLEREDADRQDMIIMSRTEQWNEGTQTLDVQDDYQYPEIKNHLVCQHFHLSLSPFSISSPTSMHQIR